MNATGVGDGDEGVFDPPQANDIITAPAIDVPTGGPTAYLRLHGRNAHAYLTGKTVPERFARMKDPLAGVLGKGIRMDLALKRMDG